VRQNARPTQPLAFEKRFVMSNEKKKSVKSLYARLAVFAAVLGPGIITLSVGNDAGGLATYSRAGALFGFDILWIFVPLTIILIMVQEMANRMGVVTGDGLSSMIRERFGVKTTFYLMMALLFVNFRTIMAEFAGVAASAELVGAPPLLVVPICAAAVIGLVLRWDYKSVEKVFLVAAFFYITYLVAGYMVKPDPVEVAKALLIPKWIPSKAYILIVLALFGTTTAPWMAFFQQSSVVEKGIDIEDAAYSRADTIFGSVFVNFVALCIVITCAMTLHPAGIEVNNAGEAATALAPLMGNWARHLFAFGLFNASMYAACVLPLATAYTICEAMGWERGVNKRYGEAPQFYFLYVASIILGAFFVLLPGRSFIDMIIVSQVVNGILLPIVLVFILILVNDSKIMGTHTNGRIYNYFCVTTVAFLTVLSVAYIVSLFL